MVKLGASSVIQGKNKEKALLWEQIVGNSLASKEKYSCVSKKTMVGQLILLFAKDEIKHRLSYLRTSKVKTGLGGQGGNKGSVAVRFSFDDSTFGFMNCHLASGQSETKERLSDLKQIVDKSFDLSQKFFESNT